mmetsp:Transcript_6774/g.19825  ORF Transcript_6774/g.19825 Transcript_6774/m.19825 type:complete len:320 (+) Transcript_6774:584-1543(+)
MPIQEFLLGGNGIAQSQRDDGFHDKCTRQGQRTQTFSSENGGCCSGRVQRRGVFAVVHHHQDHVLHWFVSVRAVDDVLSRQCQRFGGWVGHRLLGVRVDVCRNARLSVPCVRVDWIGNVRLDGFLQCLQSDLREHRSLVAPYQRQRSLDLAACSLARFIHLRECRSRIQMQLASDFAASLQRFRIGFRFQPILDYFGSPRVFRCRSGKCTGAHLGVAAGHAAIPFQQGLAAQLVRIGCLLVVRGCCQRIRLREHPSLHRLLGFVRALLRFLHFQLLGFSLQGRFCGFRLGLGAVLVSLRGWNWDGRRLGCRLAGCTTAA